jgi:hypothetical protein
MAKSIVAAALTGLMTPNNYRPTPYGPATDWSGNASAAFDAGKNLQDARHARPQQVSDDEKARKIMTIQNNASVAQLWAASSHADHARMEETTADNKVFAAPYQDYEDNIRSSDPSLPSAYLGQGLTAEEVLKVNKDGTHSYNLSDSNVMQDGTIDVINQKTGKSEAQPTFMILNPAVGKIALTEAQTAKLAEINPAFKDIYKTTGGSVRMGVTAYTAAVNEYNTVTHAEGVLNDLNHELNGKDKKGNPVTLPQINLSAAVRSNPKILPALKSLTNAGAAGNTVDNNRSDNLLHTLLTAPNGGDVLKMIGLDADSADQKIQDIDNKRKAASAEAGYQGHIDVAEQNAINKQALEDRKEVQKKQNLMGYAEDANGKLQYVSKYDVEDGPNAGKYSAQTFSEIKPSDVAKDRALVKPLGDVQMNLNHYRTAANNYSAAVAKNGIDKAHVASDKTNLNTIVSDSDVLDAAAHASAGGFGISIPTVSLTLAAAKKQKLMDAYNALTPEGKQLADNYARARAAIPAWVKALTNAGRGSKEQLEIELQNLLPPAYETEDIHNRLDGFQDNLNNQKTSIPQNLLGQRMPVAVVRADRAPQGATGLVRNNHGEAVGYIVNGRPVDSNGDPLGRQ